MKQPFPKYAFFNNELYVSVKTIEPVPTTGRDAAIVCRRASGNAAEAEERYVEQRLWLEAAFAVNETARSRGKARRTRRLRCSGRSSKEGPTSMRTDSAGKTAASATSPPAKTNGSAGCALASRTRIRSAPFARSRRSRP